MIPLTHAYNVNAKNKGTHLFVEKSYLYTQTNLITIKTILDIDLIVCLFGSLPSKQCNLLSLMEK